MVDYRPVNTKSSGKKLRRCPDFVIHDKIRHYWHNWPHRRAARLCVRSLKSYADANKSTFRRNRTRMAHPLFRVRKSAAISKAASNARCLPNYAPPVLSKPNPAPTRPLLRSAARSIIWLESIITVCGIKSQRTANSEVRTPPVVRLY